MTSSTLDRWITSGKLQHRPDPKRSGRGSVGAASVHALAEERRAAAEQRAQRKAEWESHRRVPPDTEHEWVGLTEAAQIVGMSVMGLTKRTWREAVPFTEHNGQRWFRRDHMELMGRARLDPPLG